MLGDIIDKGPDSIRLAKLLFSMPNVYCIAGNHEYDFLKYYRALMRQTEEYDLVLEELRGYFTDGKLLDWETVDKFDFLPFYVETDDFYRRSCGHSRKGRKAFAHITGDVRAARL